MGLFSSPQKGPARKNIFISYRVSDTAGETGRLVDSLKQHFFDDQIFIDIDKIEPGVDFTEAIAKSLESCDVMLAIIGPNWAGVNTTTNTSRIKNSNDWVRLEISTALKRNIRVVPVLVDGAELPTEGELPEDLHPLTKRQAYEISNKRWRYDTEELIRFLVRSVGIIPKNQNPIPVKLQKSWLEKNLAWVIIGGIFIIAIGITASNSGEKTGRDKEPEYYKPGPVVDDNKPIIDDKKPVVNDPNIPAETITRQHEIGGTWYDANGLYYFMITQNGNSLTATSYSMAGQQTGQGNGVINNKQVSLDINVTGFGLFTINTVLSKDEKNLSGTLKIENNGVAYTEPLHLTRK